MFGDVQGERGKDNIKISSYLVFERLRKNLVLKLQANYKCYVLRSPCDENTHCFYFIVKVFKTNHREKQTSSKYFLNDTWIRKDTDITLTDLFKKNYGTLRSKTQKMWPISYSEGNVKIEVLSLYKEGGKKEGNQGTNH